MVKGNGEAYSAFQKNLNGYVRKTVEQRNRIVELEKQNESLLKENQSLEQQNNSLVKTIEDFKIELRVFYLTAKDYLRERTKPEVFQNVFNGILRAFKEHIGVFASHNENKAFKSHLNEIYDSDKDFVHTQQKKTAERDFGGMER